MASTISVAKLIELLLSRPEAKAMGRRAVESATSGGGGIGVSKQLNAPRMITVVVAWALTVFGLSQTVLTIDFITDLMVEQDIEVTAEQAWMALTASPLLIIAGSVLRGL